MEELLRIAKAVAFPLRLLILQSIGGEGRSLSEIAGLVGITAGTAHHHLSKLVESGLCRKDRRGRHVIYGWGSTRVSLAVETVRDISDADSVSAHD